MPFRLPEVPFLDQKGKTFSMLISPEPLIGKGWLTPQNDRKHQVSISVSYNIYPSDHRKYPFWTKKKTTKNKIGHSPEIRYLLNRWSHRVGWPLKMTANIDFLLVFHIMYAHQTAGSTLFGPKRPKRAKISYLDISRTIDRKRLVDPSKWPQTLSFY